MRAFLYSKRNCLFYPNAKGPKNDPDWKSGRLPCPGRRDQYGPSTGPEIWDPVC
jgi:hypothetical protein